MSYYKKAKLIALSLIQTTPRHSCLHRRRHPPSAAGTNTAIKLGALSFSDFKAK